MKKATSKLLLFFFCMSFLMVIPMKANAAEIIPVNISVEYGQTEARSIFDMINEMRTNSSDAWYWNEDDTTKTTCSNLSELAYDYDLERLAMQRASEIALSYDHTRPNGKLCFSIYTDEGITYRAVGENIAAGYYSAESVNQGWREDNDKYADQGHRRNMLSSNYNCVGIGHVYYNGCHYWVEEFAYKTSANTTETTVNDSEQIATVSVAKNNIKNLKVIFDKDSYTLRTGETLTPDITAMITVSNQWGSKGIVADLPTISVDDSSIATYSNGKLSGIAEGTTTLTASLYGLTATDMPTVSVHECDNHWDQGKITTEPTCIKTGEKTFTCTICNNTKTEPVSTTDHLNTVIRNQKDSTCKEEGYTGDTYCSDCGTKISSGQSIAKTENHSWDAGKITTEPTCTENGEKTFTCIICGNTKTETVNATGHSYGEYTIVKEPTNSEEGTKSKTCSTCGKVYSITIPKINSVMTPKKDSVTTPNKDSSETNPDQNPQLIQKTTKKIKLNRSKLTLKKSKTFKLKVTLTPKDSQDKIIYKTSNKKVAKVSKSGKIKAIRKGKANITVISGEKKIVCKVTVK